MWPKWTVISTKSPMVFLSSVLFLCLMGCVGTGGTQVQITPDALSTPKQRFSESIVMQQSAEDRRVRG
jgi:hypothetical protein